MKDQILQSEIEKFGKAYNTLAFLIQKKSEELRKSKLDGISAIEMAVLYVIEKNPNLVLKEIISSLDVSASTLTGVVNRLERRGLITRIINKDDRRSFGLVLTEEGKIVQQKRKQSEERLWRKIMEVYDTSEERNNLIQLLSIIADRLSE